VLGVDHADTLVTQLELADDLWEQHRDPEASEVARRAAEGLERVRGVSFHRTQAAYQALHDRYAANGRADEASRWGRKIIH
jgi:predicted aldo/keto reductase-like oxidoreductase